MNTYIGGWVLFHIKKLIVDSIQIIFFFFNTTELKKT